MKTLRFLAFLPLALALTVHAAYAVPVKVDAAASLTEAFDDIAAAYMKTHPSDQVLYSFAGSPTLRTQIQEGAPIDVFASADRPNMDALASQHLVGPQQVFAQNVMVVVVPAKSPKVTMISELADPGVKIVLAGPAVPAGHYAEEVLAKMTPGLEEGFAKKVMANVVSRETNVKAVLAKVALGEADAGFVFATDAHAAGDKVQVLPIRPQYNVVGEYPIAMVTNTRNPMGAQSFIKFVMSRDGQTILRARGFLPARAPKP